MTIQPRTSTVTIFQGDYLDRIRHLEQKAEAAREAADGAPRMNDEVPDYVRLAEEHDALVKEAEETAVHVVLRALRRSEWRELVAAHPPRDGHDGDKSVGVNEDAFKDALVPASVVEPDGFVDDLDYLSDADYDRLYVTAFALNRGVVAGPKANLVSRMISESDET